MPVSDYSIIVDRLRKALPTSLPGAQAQALMSSKPLRVDWEKDLGRIPQGTRDAAVLVLIYPRDGKAYMTLTQRTETLEAHRSQISFPGGAMEAGETLEEAALREAHEEIGLAPNRVEILGRLTPLHVPVSCFLIHPLVGTVTRLPELRKDPVEVAEILEASVEQLMKRETISWSPMDRPRGRLLVPYFILDTCDVWGATAMILSELLSILGWQGPPEPPDESPPD
jgi:8-oxo-dGTP pyrophosphatase MutT (NUDIX family)